MLGKKKIYHIHTDFKFLRDSERFDDERFENILVTIGERNEKNKAYHEKAFFFPNHEDSIPKIVDLISDGDLVVINELCEFKKKIVSNLPLSLKIAWRFFGHELYGRRRDLMLSRKTLEIVENKSAFFPTIFFNLILKIKFYRRNKLFKKEQFIIDRINYILLFSVEEFLFLKRYWEIPEFIQLNLNFRIPSLPEDLKKEKNNIIVGNSRNIFNNHIDLLEIIKKNNNPDYSFKLLFNYGATGKYSSAVEKLASEIKNIKIVNDFLERGDFEALYENASALIINSHRQMALGNIVTGIKHGVKIYLNEKNVTKDWLQNNNISIYSVSNLESDLKTGNVHLSEQEKRNNILKFNEMVDIYSRKEFCNNIYKKINE